MSGLPVGALLQQLVNDPSVASLTHLENPAEFQSFVDAYENVLHDTLDMRDGATAQFWLQCCKRKIEQQFVHHRT